MTSNSNQDRPLSADGNGSGIDVNKLRRRMKVTKSNRFNYSKRLNGRIKNLSFSIHTLSLLSIVMGIYLLAFSNNLSANGAQFVGTVSIGISVISIIVSQIHPAAIDSRIANDAHKCAREVSALYRKLEAGTVDADRASEEYERIISSYDDNHDRCDYMMTLQSYSRELASDRKEQGANFINGNIASYLSQKSPFLMTCLGLLLTVSVFFSTPFINKMFNEVNHEETDPSPIVEEDAPSPE